MTLLEDLDTGDWLRTTYRISGTDVNFYAFNSGIINVWIIGEEYPIQSVYNYKKILNFTEEELFQYSLVDEWILYVHQYVKYLYEKGFMK